MEIIRKDQVYFADKDRHSGVFELFNLTDFPVRTNDNIRKAYLRKHCPAYVKGDSAATAEIAGHMDTAVQNGAWILRTVDGIPKLEDNDVRSQWLYQCGKHSQQSRKQLSFWKACKRKKIKLDANPVVASDWCLLFADNQGMLKKPGTFYCT